MLKRLRKWFLGNIIYIFVLSRFVNSVSVRFYQFKNSTGLVYSSSSDAGCNNFPEIKKNLFAYSIETDTCIIVYAYPNCVSWSRKVDRDNSPDWQWHVKSYHVCNDHIGGYKLNIDITKYYDLYNTPSDIPEVLESYQNVCDCINVPKYVQEMSKWSINNNGNNMLAYYESDCSKRLWEPKLVPAGHQSDTMNMADHQMINDATNTTYKIQSLGPDPNSKYFKMNCEESYNYNWIMPLELLETQQDLNVMQENVFQNKSDPSVGLRNKHRIVFFENTSFLGRYYESNLTESCQSFPRQFTENNERASQIEVLSVKTDICVMLFTDNKCSSLSIKVYPSGSVNLTRNWEFTVTSEITLDLLYNMFPNWKWVTGSFHACNENEGSSQHLTVDLTSYLAPAEKESKANQPVPVIYNRYVNHCSCQNIPSNVQAMDKYSLENHGNSLIAYFERDCKNTQFDPLWIPAGHSSYSIGFGSFAKTVNDTKHVVQKIQSIGPDTKAEYFQNGCAKLNKNSPLKVGNTNNLMLLQTPKLNDDATFHQQTNSIKMYHYVSRYSQARDNKDNQLTLNANETQILLQPSVKNNETLVQSTTGNQTDVSQVSSQPLTFSSQIVIKQSNVASTIPNQTQIDTNSPVSTGIPENNHLTLEQLNNSNQLQKRSLRGNKFSLPQNSGQSTSTQAPNDDELIDRPRWDGMDIPVKSFDSNPIPLQPSDGNMVFTHNINGRNFTHAVNGTKILTKPKNVNNQQSTININLNSKPSNMGIQMSVQPSNQLQMQPSNTVNQLQPQPSNMGIQMQTQPTNQMMTQPRNNANQMNRPTNMGIQLAVQPSNIDNQMLTQPMNNANQMTGPTNLGIQLAVQPTNMGNQMQTQLTNEANQMTGVATETPPMMENAPPEIELLDHNHNGVSNSSKQMQANKNANKGNFQPLNKNVQTNGNKLVTETPPIKESVPPEIDLDTETNDGVTHTHNQILTQQTLQDKQEILNPINNNNQGMQPQQNGNQILNQPNNGNQFRGQPNMGNQMFTQPNNNQMQTQPNNGNPMPTQAQGPNVNIKMSSQPSDVGIQMAVQPSNTNNHMQMQASNMGNQKMAQLSGITTDARPINEYGQPEAELFDHNHNGNSGTKTKQTPTDKNASMQDQQEISNPVNNNNRNWQLPQNGYQFMSQANNNQIVTQPFVGNQMQSQAPNVNIKMASQPANLGIQISGQPLNTGTQMSKPTNSGNQMYMQNFNMGNQINTQPNLGIEMNTQQNMNNQMNSQPMNNVNQINRQQLSGVSTDSRPINENGPPEVGLVGHSHDGVSNIGKQTQPRNNANKGKLQPPSKSGQTMGNYLPTEVPPIKENGQPEIDLDTETNEGVTHTHNQILTQQSLQDKQEILNPANNNNQMAQPPQNGYQLANQPNNGNQIVRQPNLGNQMSTQPQASNLNINMASQPSNVGIQMSVQPSNSGNQMMNRPVATANQIYNQGFNGMTTDTHPLNENASPEMGMNSQTKGYTQPNGKSNIAMSMQSSVDDTPIIMQANSNPQNTMPTSSNINTNEGYAQQSLQNKQEILNPRNNNDQRAYHPQNGNKMLSQPNNGNQLMIQSNAGNQMVTQPNNNQVHIQSSNGNQLLRQSQGPNVNIHLASQPSNNMGIQMSVQPSNLGNQMEQQMTNANQINGQQPSGVTTDSRPMYENDRPEVEIFDHNHNGNFSTRPKQTPVNQNAIMNGNSIATETPPIKENGQPEIELDTETNEGITHTHNQVLTQQSLQDKQEILNPTNNNNQFMQPQQMVQPPQNGNQMQNQPNNGNQMVAQQNINPIQKQPNNGQQIVPQPNINQMQKQPYIGNQPGSQVQVQVANKNNQISGQPSNVGFEIPIQNNNNATHVVLQVSIKNDKVARKEAPHKYNKAPTKSFKLTDKMRQQSAKVWSRKPMLPSTTKRQVQMQQSNMGNQMPSNMSIKMSLQPSNTGNQIPMPTSNIQTQPTNTSIQMSVQPSNTGNQMPMQPTNKGKQTVLEVSVNDGKGSVNLPNRGNRGLSDLPSKVTELEQQVLQLKQNPDQDKEFDGIAAKIKSSLREVV